jgi:hypothetical protein
MFKPTTLLSAIWLARIQDKLQVKMQHHWPTSTNVTLNTPTPPQTAMPLARHLTLVEAKERQGKQLCYHCIEKWVARHICKQKELFLGEGEGSD